MSLIGLGRRPDGLALMPGERPPKKERWGASKAPEDFVCAVPYNVPDRELNNYYLQVRMDDLSKSLRNGTFIPPDGRRSPSPPPTFDASGRRTNAREIRYRQRAEDERASLLEQMLQGDPTLRPTDSNMVMTRKGGRPTDRVFIPADEFPDVNFFGLIVGPRGKSLQAIERKTGAKVSIRGKGSVKEGKATLNADEESLHCLVSADTEEELHAAVKLLNSIIETAASTPEGQNAHKRSQLRELALLNGTLREDDFGPNTGNGHVCQNCGLSGHRRFDCPYTNNVTQSTRCMKCGGFGHLARDCKSNQDDPNGTTEPTFDQDFQNVMAEIGGTSTEHHTTDSLRDEFENKIPPWRIPSNWPSDWSVDISSGYNTYQEPYNYQETYSYTAGPPTQASGPTYAYPYGAYDPSIYYHRHGYNVLPADSTGEAVPPPPMDVPPPPPPEED